MKQKIFYLLLTALLLMNHSMSAVPACPYPIQYAQPDGSVITIILKGDEWIHWAVSTDGYTLLVNSDGFYEYAQKDASGDLSLSGIRAHDLGERSPSEIAFLKTSLKNVQYSREQVEALKQVVQTKETAVKKWIKNRETKAQKTTGTVRAPLILVQFPGKLFKKSKQDFELLVNQVNYTAGGTITGSVRDYFLANSYGKLDFQVDVFGPYTLEHNISYYDFNNGGEPDVMAREAAYAAAADGCDFTNYDLNDDGIVDGIHIIFAGYGQEAGAPIGNSIWSHASTTYAYINNMTISRYSCSPELRNTSGSNITYIGVIAHELSHVFGLPDFYDTDYEVQGQSIDTGEWDIMARGSWNDRGRTPANHTAWSKNYLGWTPAVELVSEANVTLPNPAEQGAAYKINTPTPNEYFLMENRQKQGWDAYIPSSGMLIYHVDENYAGWSSNCVNCNPSHRGLYIKQAGGGLYSDNENRTTDPYPSSENTSFTDFSIPNAKSWANDGRMTEKPITRITHNTTNRTVSFKFMESPDDYDAALIRFIDLSAVDYRTGQREIKVEMENQGKIFNAATITWSVDGQKKTPYQWTGSLAYNKKDTVSVGIADLSIGVHTISASVSIPNDVNTMNDTINITFMIKAPKTIPYSTEFNGSLDDWESVDIAGGLNWQWANNPNYLDFFNINTSTWENGYALYSIVADGHSIGPNPVQAALLSPAFDLSNIESAIDLSFESVAMSYYTPTTLKVQASTDNFQNQIEDLWSQIISRAWESTSDAFVVDLSSFAGQSNVQIRFLYSGGEAFGWAIDDIKIKLNNEPRLKTLSVTPGELAPAFNPGISNYQMKVSNRTSAVNIQATAVRSTDIITGTGIKSLNEGENKFNIIVSTQDGSSQKVYQLVVMRMKEAFIVPFVEDFESSATVASWTTVNGLEANQWVVGSATAASGTHSAYISNNGGVANHYDSQTSSISYFFCDIYFSPHTDNSYIYQLSFDWKGIGEWGYDYLAVFLADTDIYPVAGTWIYTSNLGSFGGQETWQKEKIPLWEIQQGETKRLIFAWINDSSVEGQPPIAIDNIGIQLIDPNEAILRSLTVSAGSLSPNFNSNTFNYTVSVPNEVNRISIGASAMRSIDKVSGTGMKLLSLGENKYDIVVSNPSGSVKNTYQIVVERMRPRFDVPFTENFETANNKWVLANGNQANQWVIGSAVAASGNRSAYISNDGGISNSYTRVSDENVVYLFCDVYFTPFGRAGRYLLSFDWKGTGGNNNLISAYLTRTDNSEPIAGQWLNGWYDHLGSFEYAETWQKAVIDLSGYIFPGDTRRMIFRWLNTDGIGRKVAPAIDNITVQYTDDTDASLRSLAVDQGVLSPAFNPQIFNYTANVSSEVGSTVIQATASQLNAIVAGANEKVDLNLGANTFYILVLAGDLNYRNTYKVTVNRSGTAIESPSIASLKVYPTFTTGWVYVENSEDAEISVYNLPGELLLRTKQNSIDLSGYPKGIYVLQVKDKKVKVVKN